MGLSLCIPPFCYGASSASVGSAKGDFASVSDQSGIKTGDGGFNVNVQGNTELKASLITSSQPGVTER